MKTVKTRWAFDTSTHLSASSLGRLWKRSGIGWKTRQVQTCRATHFGPKIQALLNEIFRCITSAINIINLYSVRYFLCWKNSEDPRKNSLWRSMSFQIQLMERGSGEEWCNLWNTPNLQVTVPENLNVLLKWFSTSAETVIVPLENYKRQIQFVAFGGCQQRIPQMKPFFKMTIPLQQTILGQPNTCPLTAKEIYKT